MCLASLLNAQNIDSTIRPVTIPLNNNECIITDFEYRYDTEFSDQVLDKLIWYNGEINCERGIIMMFFYDTYNNLLAAVGHIFLAYEIFGSTLALDDEINMRVEYRSTSMVPSSILD